MVRCDHTQDVEIKVRDINPFGIRMPADLKEKLTREAKINGRSLNSELVDRLDKSLRYPADNAKSDYSAQQAYSQNYGLELSEAERQLIAIFRKMSPDKQLALLALL